MRRPKVNLANTSDFTDNDWKQLEHTGILIKGDRIIRTLASIKRTEELAGKEIRRIAKGLFN